MVLSMILKNEVLRSLVATKENNIHSINDMISMKINAIVIANSSQHLRILEENSKTKNKINIETITFNDIFNDKTLVKILNGTHAVIYGETSTVDLFKLNYKYPLHLSMSENQRLMSAFVMKKSLDEQIQRKINKA